jgi:Protein of unknown function (DUF3443)
VSCARRGVTRLGLCFVGVVSAIAMACGSTASTGGGFDSGKGSGDGGTGGGDTGIITIGTSGGGSGGGTGGGSGSGTTSSGTGSGGGSDSGTGSGGGSDGNNIAPMVVNNGPPNAGGSSNVPFITVTVCVPGTTTCQTIDYITVDTGSSGLRLVSSILTIALPQTMASDGNPLVECTQFADGYIWGSVRTADVKIAGEVAGSIPVQVFGDPSFTNVPSACSSGGPSENTIMSFGSYGLVGINQIVPDCGEYCADPTQMQSADYYSCSSSACTAVTVPVANQVSNPIASFATDNNGAILELPSIPAGGAATASGTLVFGIGTQANNALGAESILGLDEYGNFTTVFAGTTMSTSFIDSGTNTFAVNDSALTQCGSDLQGYYCPASTTMLTAVNSGNAGNTSATSNVSFTVESANTLFSGSDTAFDDIATTGIDNMSFDWGLPFFYGRNVYVALDGATTPGGAGPFVAY